MANVASLDTRDDMLERIKDRYFASEKTHCCSEQIEWRHLFYRGTPKSSKTKKNILRTFPLVRDFPFKVAANFLEHSFSAFIEKASPFMPT